MPDKLPNIETNEELLKQIKEKDEQLKTVKGLKGLEIKIERAKLVYKLSKNGFKTN